MKDKYIPPYEINEEILALVTKISENLGKISNVHELEKLPRLRRVNRIKSIHSSLAIENYSLSLDETMDVIDGKNVVGPIDDIKAVKNANEAYAELGKIDPFSLDHLLKIHGIMMKVLIKDAGKLRSGQVGVYNENGQIIHLAPPAELVPSHLYRLFDWLKNSSLNMLIKSSIFHYEFEFIHPFNDGNGRIGRLWQTALLSTYKPLFMWLPIESLIKDKQEEYYKAIIQSTNQGTSNPFILYMLHIINESIENLVRDTKNHLNHINNQMNALLNVIESYPQSAIELMKKLNLKSRITFQKNYLKPAIEAGLVKMSEPSKPTSKNQKYYKD